jgi:hypothetical protein
VGFRLGTPDDDAKIVALSNAHFGTPLTLEDWQWFVYGNPNGVNRIYIMESEGEMAGCYCVFPTVAKVGDRRYATGFPHHLIIQKPYRSAQAFVDFSEFMFEHERQRGTELLITAPNKNSYHPQKTLAGWSDFGEMGSLYKPVSGIQYHRCTPVAEFAGAFESLICIASAETAFYFEKSASWLNWRYMQRPSDPYIAFSFHDSRLEGFIVVKHWRRKAHIIDWWALTGNAMAHLLAAAETYATDRELDLWCITGYPYREYLKYLDYKIRETPQPIIVRALDGSTPPLLSGRASFMYGDGDGY